MFCGQGGHEHQASPPRSQPSVTSIQQLLPNSCTKYVDPKVGVNSAFERVLTRQVRGQADSSYQNDENNNGNYDDYTQDDEYQNLFL
ncbi:hypothetical protein HOLleu_10506 [Holothuria leucospilota]|uniref:Uncharacterized protein n=1 Tax=Holothuria leucospilota TaxID=206669 RepID=A0A9Q1HFS0_HOLLE|nr:hypothetical protein HOLleu_10506 [Holothuria leucospilota]